MLGQRQLAWLIHSAEGEWGSSGFLTVLLKLCIMPKKNKKSGGKALRRPPPAPVLSSSDDDEDDVTELRALVARVEALEKEKAMREEQSPKSVSQ